jgi:hypothetical protein
MARYVGLPGVKGGVLESDASFKKSVSGFIRGLTPTNRVVSGACDYGAITVWRDDDGMYRADFCRRMIVIDGIVVKKKVTVAKWLKTWIPKMSERPS